MDKATSIADVKTWVRILRCARWDDPHSQRSGDWIGHRSLRAAGDFRFIPTDKEKEILQSRRGHIADGVADSFYFLLRLPIDLALI